MAAAVQFAVGGGERRLRNIHMQRPDSRLVALFLLQPAGAALVGAIDRMPTDSEWPELARAQVSLSEHSPRI